MSRLLACVQAPRVEQSPADSLLIAHYWPLENHAALLLTLHSHQSSGFYCVKPSQTRVVCFLWWFHIPAEHRQAVLFCSSAWGGNASHVKPAGEAHFWRTIMKGFDLILCLSWTPKYIHWDRSRSSNFKNQGAVTARSVHGRNSDLTVLWRLKQRYLKYLQTLDSSGLQQLWKQLIVQHCREQHFPQWFIRQRPHTSLTFRFRF